MSNKKDMYYNFDMMMPRLIDSINHLDVKHANSILRSIDANCICTGTGGSNTVSEFASIILEHCNGIIAVNKEPRDIFSMSSIRRYSYSLGITYGNNNYGINEAIKRFGYFNITPRLITNNSNSSKDICYKGNLPNEHSFISLASTIIPMSILLNYFLNSDKNELLELVGKLYLNASKIEHDFNFNEEIPLFEIMTGDNTYVASKILESTIVEAGLGTPVNHEKYSYHHGRSTLAHLHKNSNLIYLINMETNIDNELLTELKDKYRNIIILESKENDYIIGEFYLALKSLFLCKSIAEQQKKDLSVVEYSPVVKKLYRYKGGM